MIPQRLEDILRADAPASVLAELFGGAGKELYLVGGSVRDLMLGVPHGDLDFATDALPDEIIAIVEGWASDVVTIGAEFGTVGVVKGGDLHEITTFRSEVYRDDSRKPSVSYSDNIVEDLSRRDFTVNAMALRLPEPEMIDPHGGLDDLAAGILRTPLEPAISFGDDPLRMLRMYRFVSQLGFEADPAAVDAVAQMHSRLDIISAERVRDELARLLKGEHVAEGLSGLVDSGLAGQFLPEFTALALSQDPVHRHKDVLAHTIAVVEKCPPQLTLRLAALLHDIGKPDTRSFEGRRVTFHHHEVVGSRMARDRLRALRFPKTVVSDVSRLVYLHMRPHTYALGWTDRAVRRYVRDAGHLLEDLNYLVRCDVTTANAKRARQIAKRIDELEERIIALRQTEKLDALRPPIDGNDVMRHLEVDPGPVVGEAMSMLMEHRLDHGPYLPEDAFKLLDAWWEERQG
ncbi:MAG: CCA tRNA nucleotidyltransferase [Acidimicrobiia bacterium]|nr:CCA tRNA nucleotidyltransferase [Acidimicrobiia bacterium]